MVILKSFKEGDGERVMEIASRAFTGMGLDRLAIDKSLPRDKVREVYRSEARGYVKKALDGDENLEMIVAEEENLIVGYIVLSVNAYRSEIFGFKWASILSLAIDPEWWGRGIGSNLVKEGLKRLREGGARYVEVFTDQNNIAAIRVFEKNGFRVIYSGIILSQYLME
jgi:ribosomal protein S18 acetylase RimI-like enzyme